MGSSPTFSFVAGTGDRNGDNRPERVGPKPERATGKSDRAAPEREGTGLARGHRKRPSGRDRAGRQLGGRLRPDGESERSKGRLHRRDQPSGAETAGTRTPRGGESFLGVSRVLGPFGDGPTLCAMPWPEDALTQDETIVTSFRQHWKLLIIPLGWFILAMAIIAFVLTRGWWAAAKWTIVLVVVGAAMWFIVRPIISWATTRYVLTTERLMTRRGLIAKSGVEIPLERITNVNFNQSVFERMLGAGDLLVESAGMGGQSRFSNIPHPDDFAALLYKVREERSVSLQGMPQAAPAAVAPEAPSDATERLQRLKQLHNDGVLTDAEYEEKRAKLVGEI